MTPRARLRLFRLLALVLGPIVFVLVAEGALRAIGYGYDTRFFVPIEGAETTNPRYGYRFFGPLLARTPVVERLEREKKDGEYRIFVLGGSAAMGTPEPAFGVAEILEVLLEETDPSTDYVVINAAMAAINSHVVAEIARECAAREPDLFLVYLGNNEVVGPYGPGSIFGRFSPNNTFVRLHSRLKKLRLAQLLEAALRRFGRSGRRPVSWRGMEMFAEHQVAADDPRLSAAYEHLERNLREIVRRAHDAGAGVVLSTVATNLKDSPPFSSSGSSGLGEDELGRRDKLYNRTIERLRRGEAAAAVGPLEQEAAARPDSAETRFLLGTTLLATGDPRAREELVLARDLDTLRFRADSEVNRIIREVATHEGATLLAADTLLEQSPEAGGRPLGRELFYEHVHFNYLGNYRLARAFLEAAKGHLSGRTGAVPTAQRVAQRLAFSPEDAWRMHHDILRMMRRPPFTAQLGHTARLNRLALERRRLRAGSVADRATTDELYRRAVGNGPGDPMLTARYARLLAARGEAKRAETHWRRLVSLVPGAQEWRTGLGFSLADQGRFDEARTELQRVVDLYPELPEPLSNLATVLERLGETDRAEDLYRRALDLQPDFETAAINLGVLFEADGRAENAEDLYRRLTELHPRSAEAPFRLAALFDRSERLDEAEEWYRRAIRQDPGKALAHNNLGFLLERGGRLEDAAKAYARAVEEDPALAVGYFNLGDILLQTGQPAQAASMYRAGLALDPDNAQARENLARSEQELGQNPG